jgi:hypothetical protein
MLPIENIPNLDKSPLTYVFEDMKYKHTTDTLCLKFGTSDINYISQFAEKVYVFDSFEGELPQVNENVELIKGWVHETMLPFLKLQNKKISFIHIDAEIYVLIKYLFHVIKEYLNTDCIIIFNKFVNYPEFDSTVECLHVFHEFVTENTLDYDWIGMNGTIGMVGSEHEKVALVVHSVTKN